MSVSDSIKQATLPGKRPPLWAGPESIGDDGGVTFSLLSRYLQDRERFRVHVIEGLRPADKFNHKIEYGNMWHVCEEHYNPTDTDKWHDALYDYAEKLSDKYPLDRKEINKWHNVCYVQFSIYLSYWAEHPDVLTARNIYRERVFHVGYELPSCRIVYLRGKWDSIDRIGDYLWLQENKTKGEIDELLIQRQLKFDLQTMLYIIAMKATAEHDKALALPFKGVRYNVVRRPLSGGRGTIVRYKARGTKPEETDESYYGRLRGIIDGSSEDAPGPSHFFMRWNVDITRTDIDYFRGHCFDPLLEELCDWYAYVTHEKFQAHGYHQQEAIAAVIPRTNKARLVYPSIHWQYPFGIYSSLNDGGYTDMDGYLETGSEVGLRRMDTLFPELQESK